jgi:hypothetical protein
MSDVPGDCELPVLDARIPNKPLSFKDATFHMEIDFGHTFPELMTKQAAQYYKSILKLYAFHIKATSGPFSFFWRESTGGKGVAEALHCIHLFLVKYASGAGHLKVAMDTAGHVWCEVLIQYFHWISSPQNPNRMFLSVELIPLEKGHTGNGADLVSMIIDNILAQLDETPILTFDQFLEIISMHFNGVMERIDVFIDIPKMVINSGIYIKFSRKKDIDGYVKSGEFGIRKSRPLRAFLIHFVDHRSGNPVNRYVGNDVVFQVHFDERKPKLRFRILHDLYTFGKKQFPDIFSHIIIRDKKPVLRSFWKQTHELVQTEYGDQENVMQYWHERNFIFKNNEKSPEHDSDGIKNRRKIQKNMENWINFQSLVESRPQHQTKKRRKKQKQDAASRTCHNCLPQYTPEDMSSASSKDLQIECNTHKLSRSGKKIDLVKRLSEHYGTPHKNFQPWNKNKIRAAQTAVSSRKRGAPRKSVKNKKKLKLV